MVGKLHKMGLNPKPMGLIRKGHKRYELRLNDEKRQTLKVGDRIEFTNTLDPQDILLVEVMSLQAFTNCEALYKSLPLLECGYTSEDIDLAQASDMEAYYSLAQQDEYGVLAIEVKVCN